MDFWQWLHALPRGCPWLAVPSGDQRKAWSRIDLGYDREEDANEDCWHFYAADLRRRPLVPAEPLRRPMGLNPNYHP